MVSIDPNLALTVFIGVAAGFVANRTYDWYRTGGQVRRFKTKLKKDLPDVVDGWFATSKMVIEQKMRMGILQADARMQSWQREAQAHLPHHRIAALLMQITLLMSDLSPFKTPTPNDSLNVQWDALKRREMAQVGNELLSEIGLEPSIHSWKPIYEKHPDGSGSLNVSKVEMVYPEHWT